MKYKNKISGDGIIIYLDKNVFSKDGIFKCLYWYSDEHHITITLLKRSEIYKIQIKPNNKNLSNSNLQKLLSRIERDLIDFNLRDIITKETKNIRELLIAKAFSHGEFGESPIEEFND